MARIIWTREALAELALIIAYIEMFDQPAARRVAARLLELGESLSEFPSRGRPAPGGMRELVTVPPYVLRYEVNGDRVIILAIRHGARRPTED